METLRNSFKFSCEVFMPATTEQEAFDIFTAWWKAHRSDISVHGIATFIPKTELPPTVEKVQEPLEDLL
jgi:predicted alpha-1,6-mannanase (GH76 family)